MYVVRGKTSADVSLGMEQFQIPIIVVDQLSANVILGLDVLEDQCCTIDIGSRVLFIGARGVRLPLLTGDQIFVTLPGPVPVALVETVQLPPVTEMEVSGKVRQPVSGAWVVERVPLKLVLLWLGLW